MGSEPHWSYPPWDTPSFPGEIFWGEELLLCLKLCLKIVLWEVLKTPELVLTAQTPSISKADLGGMGSDSAVLVYQVMDKGLSPA